MKYTNLGKSDLRISRIGFGCMSLKGGIAKVRSVIDRAIELGINYYDTADLYDDGANEALLGEVFAGRRDKVVIATKVGNQMRKDGSGWDWNPNKEYILEAVEKSLRRLKIDYIDLYQLHGGTIDDPIDDTIEAFETLKSQGKIRNYGISSIRPDVIRRYAESSDIVSVMMQYSLLDRRAEESCFELLEKHRIGLLARGSVAQGLLVNKPAKPYLGKDEKEVKHIAEVLKSVSGKERSNTQTAIQFVLHSPVVTSAVVGMHTIEQLEDAVNALTVPAPGIEEINILNKEARPGYYTDHR